MRQVWGPLRARADLRFALESPPAGPGEEAGRATLEGAWRVPVLAHLPRHACMPRTMHRQQEMHVGA
jgi:hypothetical protein